MQKNYFLLLFFFMISTQSVFGAAADIELPGGIARMTPQDAFRAAVQATAAGAAASSQVYGAMDDAQAQTIGSRQRTLQRAARPVFLHRLFDSIESHALGAIIGTSFTILSDVISQKFAHWYKQRNRPAGTSLAQEESFTQQAQLLGILVSLSDTPEDVAYVARKKAILKKRIKQDIDAAIPDELLPHSAEKLKASKSSQSQTAEDAAQHKKLTKTLD